MRKFKNLLVSPVAWEKTNSWIARKEWKNRYARKKAEHVQFAEYVDCPRRALPVECTINEIQYCLPILHFFELRIGYLQYCLQYYLQYCLPKYKTDELYLNMSTFTKLHVSYSTIKFCQGTLGLSCLFSTELYHFTLKLLKWKN